MKNATGPWLHSPKTPDDPKKLCLVLLQDRQQGHTYQVMRFKRKQWFFPGNMCLSNNQRVICWAVINDEMERRLEGADISSQLRDSDPR